MSGYGNNMPYDPYSQPSQQLTDPAVVVLSCLVQPIPTTTKKRVNVCVFFVIVCLERTMKRSAIPENGSSFLTMRDENGG
jgi:hypothetical protein